ncbi:ribosomal protein S7 domain-containing protein [Kockovaella imperatae]|uniref:Ribosomal protein S7 domain-containing protein n=1 Tax=Kockovaella imperatae TaxID=4999 RepID=A0A1Y1U803_9TREE|nr:ribosomal protein S7 domain-containing protein [Kockovaella imperatae]ORX33674.1 ribosomal protein S7 domain-containing protein [Kockovaella imperatae]
MRSQDSLNGAGPSRPATFGAGPTLPSNSSMDEKRGSSSSTSSESGFRALSKLLAERNPPVPRASAQPILPLTQPIGNALNEPVQAYGPYKPVAVPPVNDPILALFTNLIMKHGRKGDAQRAIADMLAALHVATNQNPIDLVHRAVLLASPSFRVISIVRGAKRMYAPRALLERQRIHQGIAWIKKASLKYEKRLHLPKRLAKEILLVLEGSSEVFGWVEERHKVAMVNRANMKLRG